jgi:hypothetical protein
MKKNIKTDEINGEKVFVRVGWYQMAVRFCDAEGRTKKQKSAKWHFAPAVKSHSLGLALSWALSGWRLIGVLTGAAGCFLLISTNLMASEPVNVNALVQAIYIAEGGRNARKPYGILSVPCSTFPDCERVCRNTVRNNIARWEKAGRPEDYISFLGNRYAPISSHPLNRNWIPNVKKIYNQITTKGQRK